jgi:predicted PurR-regulated permease PerM
VQTDSEVPVDPALSPAADRARSSTHDPGSVILALQGGALGIAALYFGQDLLIPLVLAGLLAFVLAPAAALLQRARLPRLVAVLLTVSAAFGVVGVLGLVVWRQAASLAVNVPAYQATIEHKWELLAVPGGMLHRLMGAETLSSFGTLAAGSSILSLASRFAAPLLSPLGTAAVVLIFTLFILLYSENLRDRFVRLVGRHDLHRTIFALNDAGRRLSRYFMFQLLLNATFGVFVGAILAALGVPGAPLWGILATVMRFVPFIGIFVAVAAPFSLALATTPGFTPALLVLALYLGSEAVCGQVLEPLLYGHNTGVSPLAVIVSASFWALLWGLVGLIIATPITVCLVVIGRHVERLSFFAVMLGDSSPLLPTETFYLRALEGRSASLAPAARAQIAAGSRGEYYDRVVMGGLAQAQRDRARGVLSYERLDAVHQQVQTLTAALAPVQATEPPAATPAEWQLPNAILCIPARGQLDDLAAEMAVQTLREAGFGACFAPNAVLDAATTPDFDMANVKLCCLSALEDGATPAGIQFFVRRMQRKLPGTIAVIALWQAAGDSPVLAALRAEGRDEHMVLSIGELMAFVKAVSAQREPGDIAETEPAIV